IRDFHVTGVQTCALPISTLFIQRTEYDTAHLSPIGCTSTHYAGLNGNVQGTIAQILAADVTCCCGKCLHFCMGSHIVQPFGEVKIGRASCRERVEMVAGG